MKPLQVVFMGTPQFAVPLLEDLFNNSMVIVSCVVTMPARPAGRGQQLLDPPIAQLSKEKNITCFQVENLNRDQKFIKFTEEYKPDLVFVFAFAQFLGTKILNWPKYGCFNFHTSLLPKYRGASPIHHALLNGDLLTGSSLQKMIKELDAGDVYLEKEVGIEPNDSFSDLSIKLNNANIKLLNVFLEKLLTTGINSFLPRKQNPLFISHAKEISKSQGEINFFAMGAEEILRKYNAFSEWPNIYTLSSGHKYKLNKLKLNTGEAPPGSIEGHGEYLRIGTKFQSIDLYEIQPENKKMMKIKDYLNGKKGSIPLTIEQL